MKDFVTYVLSEAKNKRLSVTDAVELIRQYKTPVVSDKPLFLHPLLQQNTSNFSKQRFSSIFTSEEFFLADHIINGRPVLPGVAYLEMARAAVELAVSNEAPGASGNGTSAEERTGIKLKNIIWAQPMVIGEQPVQVHLELYPEDEDEGAILFEVYSEPREADTDPEIYCRGQVIAGLKIERPPFDLKYLQTQCTPDNSWPVENSIKPPGIESIYIGQGQVLAKLSIPSAILYTEDQYVLHPSIMESALEASFGLFIGSGDRKSDRSFMPVALQEIEIIRGCTTSMWALIRHHQDNETGANSKVDTRVQRLDIDICDEQGTVCIRMKSLEMHETTDFEIAPPAGTEEAYELMTFEEVWQEQTLLDTRQTVGSSTYPKTLVCFLTDPESHQTLLETIKTFHQATEIIFISQGETYQKLSPNGYNICKNNRNDYEEAFRSIREEADRQSGGREVDTVLYLWPIEDPGCIEDYSSTVYILQALILAKLKVKRVLFASEFVTGLERSYLESWIGFERSAKLIMMNTQIAVIGREVAGHDLKAAFQDWPHILWAELQADQFQSVLYQGGKRNISRIQPVIIPLRNSLLRSGGTYLVTGGCGGLGFLFATYLAKLSKPGNPVKLILCGRSPIDPEKQSKIAILENLGGRVMYIQVDVCEPVSLKNSLASAKERFGDIHGVIHAAGITNDQDIAEKEFSIFQTVLDPKIKGTLALDQVLQQEPLDFICYFSSMVAVLGDFGACDYAIGNRFQMAYADYRNQSKERFRGKAIVIGWPLWKNGGMKFKDNENTKLYMKSSGLRLLENEEGIAIFDRIMSQTNTQYLILAGQPKRVHQFLRITPEQPAATPIVFGSSDGSSKQTRGRQPEMKGWSLEQCLEWDLKGLINKLLRVSRDKLDREKNLADFGFNSIGLTQFAIRLIKYYGIDEITPALFFKYSTLEKLIQYFLIHHQTVMEEFYGEEVPAASHTATVSSEISFEPVPSKRQITRARASVKSRFGPKDTIPGTLEPIAIIGMSGRFPGARNVDELWNILATGQNMVGEIPPERFDWRQYYGGPHSEPGKINCKWCGCIPGVREFDPLFFEISPREAEIMDPRQRLLLQESWKALEDAGYGTGQIRREKIGMFVGVEMGDYGFLLNNEESVTSVNNAILAARLAYFLNLNGPVMAIDTACSSGLVAAHQAIMSLRNNECDTVIAAGVNLMLSPKTFVVLSQAGMLSSDGKCYAFDKRANGMVPGEAVAVLVFKRLSKAEADGDPIYAVIKGSGINYDGKTNGITAPSGIAQTNLLKMVYDQYRINPEDIEYIVTHGTGTKLGDPIEINALYDAFKEYTKKCGYCALTSTKTNVGHTFSPAGLISVMSLVQALRHEMIPASLNCDQENDYINWKESPFYVNKSNKPWPGAASGAHREGASFSGRDNISGGAGIPRMGAVSAFGMSGTNVHMVVQSYVPNDEIVTHKCVQAPYYLLALSAKTEESLHEKIKDMIEALQNKDLQGQSLSQISFTLLEGRQHFRYRCAIVAQDHQNAIYLLQQIGSRESIPNLYQGKVSRDFKGQKVMEQYTQDLLKQLWTLRENPPKYQEILFVLADLYCQGYEPDWKLLYGDIKPQRIHLPTYPFVKQSYWIPESESKPGITDTTMTVFAGSRAFHPLLHQNDSDFAEQRFSSIFTGSEFFLKDHVIKGQRVMPGVAYLEMVRAAVAQAAAIFNEGSVGIRLKNVVWARPIVVGEKPVRINIGLYPEERIVGQGGALIEVGSEINYEIYSLPHESAIAGNDEYDQVVYSQGSAVLSSIMKAPILDLKGILAGCNQITVSAGEIYNTYKDMGIDYGPGFQGVESVYVGAGQLLARLSLPSGIANSIDQFVLHPSIMDSALQASLGFAMAAGDFMQSGVLKPLKPGLPFALQELEILGRCTATMWALVRFSNGVHDGAGASDGHAVPETNKLQKFDIDLCDDQGTILVRMRGYSSRILEGEVDSTRESATIGTLMLAPVWKDPITGPETVIPNYTQHLVILCEMDEILPTNIETQMNGVRCLSLHSKEYSLDQRFQAYAGEVFEEIQKLFKDKTTSKSLIQVMISGQAEQQLFSGLSGILKTAQLENPKLVGQIIECEPGEDIGQIVAQLQENRLYPSESHICYNNGKRMVLGWSELLIPGEATATVEVNIPWKDRGIYLITGGAGGLGLIFANEIAHKVKEATLILTGRSPLDPNKQIRFQELEMAGIKVIYRQVDVTNQKAVNDLIQNIEAEYGNLHGIIHSAGVIKDNFIIKKTKDELFEVLAPKVSGLINLDEASKKLNLDFFVFCSSMAGSMGNPGQADYSAANAFMDAYARYRNRLVISNRRYGRTLSINWPLWRDGGMHVDPETEALMLQNSGLIAMRTQTGIRAFYHAINSGKDQVMVMEGNLISLRNAFIEPVQTKTGKMAVNIAHKTAPSSIPDDSLQEKAANYFKKLLSSFIKLPVHQIEADAPMEKYGIDSMLVMQLTNELEKTFGSLSKTLFFEYQTIQEITGYFLESYRDRLIEVLGIEAKSAVINENESISKTDPVIRNVYRRRNLRLASFRIPSSGEKATGTLDIAIIGVSGRYPAARNIQEFWKILRDGRDCITEIPKDRWDHSLYFDEDKNKPGKTYSKWGGFLDGVDRFDPLFFNISPREAEYMDPQERLFLECAYETLEDAGYTRQSLSERQGSGFEGNVGVFVGVMYEEYQLYGAQEQIQGRPISLSGNLSSIANRVSYFCNFHGPSMVVDTMCSASLTAIHLACQSLRRGECELVIAGGVNVSIHPNKYLMLAQGKFASSKGRCESFGEGGDGYVPGEGVGAVLLKPLPKAIADGDQIYGVIKGTAVNHGGKTNGYTVPNPNAQAGVIIQALKDANIDPRTISYIEAHGTGTSLGDPIEITGLTKAFREYTGDNQFCAIGSAKSNIGHCESAAGIAGVTKVLLQLKNCQLAPSIHAEVLNPNIDFEHTPFIVQRNLTEWKRPVIGNLEFPRRAGVSSFGAGGSNAHLIIEEFISPKTIERPSMKMKAPNLAVFAAQERVIIILSAKNAERLHEQAHRLLMAIKERQFIDDNLSDIAYTLQVGREAMEERLAIIVSTISELEEKLRDWLEGRDNIVELYYGQIKRNQESLTVLAADEEMQETIAKWIQHKKYEKLAVLWVKGLVFDWNLLYDNVKPDRISLPTYPFAREGCWFSESFGTITAETKPARDIRFENTREGVSINHSSEFPIKTFQLTPVWDVVPVAKIEPFPRLTDQVVIVGGTKDNYSAVKQLCPKVKLLEIGLQDTVDTIIDKLEAVGTVNHMIWIAPQHPLLSLMETAVIESQNRGVIQVFRIIKALLRLGYGNRDLGFSIITIQTLPIHKKEVVNPTNASLYGLIGSLAKEYRNWKLRVIDLEGEASTGENWPVNDIFCLPPDPSGNPLAYRSRQWYRQQLIPIQAITLDSTLYRTKGVYVVIGGAGGIGEAWSEYMISTYKAQVIWIGRRPKDTTIQAKLDRLARLGPVPEYITADATDREALAQTYDTIKAKYSKINGVVHSAIVLLDRSFENMDEERFRAGLAAKVDVSVRLAQVFQQEPLDFVLFFSSMQSFSKAPGQSNYAAGCTFKDAFAHQLALKWPCPVKVINWGYWGSVGVVASKDYQERMARNGIGSIEPPEAMEALEKLLVAPLDQMVFFKTAKTPEETINNGELIKVNPENPVLNIQNIRNRIPTTQRLKQIFQTSHTKKEHESNQLQLQTKVNATLIKIASQLLAVKIEEIDMDAKFNENGFDPLLLSKFINRLNLEFQLELTPAIFFEYVTLHDIGEYLIETYGDILQKIYSCNIVIKKGRSANG